MAIGNFAIGKLFQWQKVAVGQGFLWKWSQRAAFTIGKDFWWQRLPMAIGNLFQWQPLPSEKVTVGNLCHRLMVKVADGNLFRWKPWLTATFCRQKSLLMAKVANGQGCHWKRYPTAKGCHLLPEAFSEGNLNGLVSVVCFFV